MMNSEKLLTKTEENLIISGAELDLPSYTLKTYNLYRCGKLIGKTVSGKSISALGKPETPKLLSQMALSLGLTVSENEITALAEDNGLYLWDDGGVCAIARIAFVGEKYARINTVFTAPDKRGHGYAGALASALAEKLMQKGLTPTVLADESNPVSNHLYQSLGFTPDGKVYEYSKMGVSQKENAIFYTGRYDGKYN